MKSVQATPKTGRPDYTLFCDEPVKPDIDAYERPKRRCGA